jgi:hypothetical protein
VIPSLPIKNNKGIQTPKMNGAQNERRHDKNFIFVRSKISSTPKTLRHEKFRGHCAICIG